MSDGAPTTTGAGRVEHVDVGAALFETAIGRCGVAWRRDSVVGVQIPEATDDDTLANLRSKLGREGARVEDMSRVPAAIDSAIRGMQALLAGEPVDLNFVDVDLGTPPPFDAAVWEATRAVPPGGWATYGQIAERIGQPGAARAVGRALGLNPVPIVVPCHRVLGADRRLVGFSANGGTETKRRMLLIERCPAVPPTLFD